MVFDDESNVQCRAILRDSTVLDVSGLVHDVDSSYVPQRLGRFFDGLLRRLLPTFPGRSYQLNYFYDGHFTPSLLHFVHALTTLE